MTASIRVNGQPQVWSGATIAELLHGLGLDPARRGLAIALNGRIVPRARWREQAIAAGDDIDIVRATQGG